MINEYVIDFERLNELTTHPNDNPISGGLNTGSFCYSSTRRCIKEYMDIYMDATMRKGTTLGLHIAGPTKEVYNKVIEVLHFNKILISSADIRDKKIDTIVENKIA